MVRHLQNLAKRGELIVPLSFLTGSMGLFYLATQFHVFIVREHLIGPDMFPKLLLGMIMALSVKLAYNAVKSGPTEFEKVAKRQNLWITLGFALAYVVLLEIVGFVVLTPIWILAYMYSIGIRRWQWLIGAMGILSVVVILVFPVLMHIPLPRGAGIFRTISLLVY